MNNGWPLLHVNVVLFPSAGSWWRSALLGRVTDSDPVYFLTYLTWCLLLYRSFTDISLLLCYEAILFALCYFKLEERVLFHQHSHSRNQSMFPDATLFFPSHLLCIQLLIKPIEVCFKSLPVNVLIWISTHYP